MNIVLDKKKGIYLFISKIMFYSTILVLQIFFLAESAVKDSARMNLRNTKEA